jgi:hypothetical protein
MLTSAFAAVDSDKPASEVAATRPISSDLWIFIDYLQRKTKSKQKSHRRSVFHVTKNFQPPLLATLQDGN